MDYIELPPAIFDYEPSNYAVMYAPAEEMPALCGWQVIACTRPAKRIIIISTGLRGAALARALRHEKAHLNGWRHA
jgi:hypothetical protein